MPRKKPYTGRVCYVGHDHEAADGRTLTGGWHHTVEIDEDAKAVAVAHAKERVALWEKRASTPGIGRFAEEQLADARAHLADVEAFPFEVPGKPLVIDEDGNYHFATADDISHHEQHHKQFVDIVPSLSQEDKERLRKLLDAQEDA